MSNTKDGQTSMNKIHTHSDIKLNNSKDKQEKRHMSQIAYGNLVTFTCDGTRHEKGKPYKRVNISTNELHVNPWFAHQNIQQTDRQMETYRDRQNYTEEIHREANKQNKYTHTDQLYKGHKNVKKRRIDK